MAIKWEIDLDNSILTGRSEQQLWLADSVAIFFWACPLKQVTITIFHGGIVLIGGGDIN